MEWNAGKRKKNYIATDSDQREPEKIVKFDGGNDKKIASWPLWRLLINLFFNWIFSVPANTKITYTYI